MSDPISAAATRHHGMDWLRIGAFGLLILYHIGMFFVPWDWHVKNIPTVDAFAWPMLALYTWRLSLLFLVSGFASRMLLRKLGGVGRFLGSRSKRLLIPLLFGILVVVAPQPWVELAAKHDVRMPFLDFFPATYLSFRAIEGVVVPTWNHLWFVAYLWSYTLLLSLMCRVLPVQARAALQAAFDKAMAGWGILAIPILCGIAIRLLLVPGQAETHGLFDDVPGHLFYLPPLLFGFALAGSRSAWPAIVRVWPVAVVFALAGFCVNLWGEITWFGENVVVPPDAATVLRSARVFNAWGMIVALLALAQLAMNRDHRWRAPLSEAVFPAYILHQTVIVVLGWWLLGTATSWPLRFIILVVATAGSCALFYLIGRRIGPLRPLIGLAALAPRRPVP